MKKHSNASQSPKREATTTRPRSITIGMDLGDKRSRYCLLDEEGKVIQEGSVATTKKAMESAFGRMPSCRIAVVAGSP